MRILTVLLRPVLDAAHPSAQRIPTEYATHPSATCSPSGLSHLLAQPHSACAQMTVIYFNNGPKAQQ